jgi:hypothetical protein
MCCKSKSCFKCGKSKSGESNSEETKVKLSPSAILRKLEGEIQKRLLNQLIIIKNQKEIISQDQITYIEQLYNDLELVNPELAYQTLQMVKSAKQTNRENNNMQTNKSSLIYKTHRTMGSGSRPSSTATNARVHYDETVRYKSVTKIR